MIEIQRWAALLYLVRTQVEGKFQLLSHTLSPEI